MLKSITSCDITDKEIPDCTGLTIWLEDGIINLSAEMCNQIVAWYISAQIKSLTISNNYSAEKLINVLKKKKKKEDAPSREIKINRMTENIVRIC
jgi:hypothetical protein